MAKDGEWMAYHSYLSSGRLPTALSSIWFSPVNNNLVYLKCESVGMAVSTLMYVWNPLLNFIKYLWPLNTSKLESRV